MITAARGTGPGLPGVYPESECTGWALPATLPTLNAADPTLRSTTEQGRVGPGGWCIGGNYLSEQYAQEKGRNMR